MASIAPIAPNAREQLIDRGRARKRGGIAPLFEMDNERFARFSAQHEDMRLDYSKTALSDDDLAALMAHARAMDLEARRNAMFAGERINLTEDRAVLHVALRGRISDGYATDGKPVGHDVERVLAAMSEFATGIRLGEVRSATGERFTDVVNIGIGGSDLGPAMATLALAPYHDGPRLHFVSNVDGAHIADTLKGLEPGRTLFIVASKTFTTVETMTNAATARRFIVAALGEDAVGAHFCAVSTALDKIRAFGIAPERSFGFWDWVGGRYSLWSAIGLPLMIATGAHGFREFLAGGRAMDQHFRDAPMERNLPMLLGLTGWWHRVAQEYPARAVIPYDQRLARLPAYLQQLDMESNGKSIGLDGKPVTGPTGPLVWGEPGTNGQHAFFQLLHQGSDVVPIEFLVAATAQESGMDEHHDLLLANCLAQSEALVKGRTLDEARAQVLAAGRSAEEAERIAPHRTFSGNRPSITIAYRRLDPYTLGRLIALYEHRVFVEAQLFGINAYDQWGVELGKELAVALLPAIKGEVDENDVSPLTRGLFKAITALR
ncbi:glucose-6-phosphate isomerase [Pelagibacterium lacus]|uniref:Glucose-6-phosphate isomerase n=1 Tax=Pelagibacterium lacus TaxID=2282655 RepID=A0A369W340_9HYPH|nr:glucose-6-phosphate isomerase [Pelagibacterium lacus]RDE08469.1 glucose-6-phosphate isomerase [Pelagibacterium lacus]